jgi:hypothetical protein
MEPGIYVCRTGAVAINANPKLFHLRDVADRLYIDTTSIAGTESEEGHLYHISTDYEFKYGLDNFRKFTFTDESKQKLGVQADTTAAGGNENLMINSQWNAADLALPTQTNRPRWCCFL